MKRMSPGETRAQQRRIYVSEARVRATALLVRDLRLIKGAAGAGRRGTERG